MRPTVSFLLHVSLAASLSLLAGCGSATDSSAERGGSSRASSSAGRSESSSTYAPPTGCRESQCALQKNKCSEAQAATCAQCLDLCNGDELATLCDEACDEKCSADDGAYDECNDAYAACQATPANAICADDDVDPVLNPGMVPPALPALTSAGACSEGEITQIAGLIGQDRIDVQTTADQEVSTDCFACAFGLVDDRTWGPLIILGQVENGLLINDGPCLQAAGSTCGDAYNEESACLALACPYTDPEDAFAPLCVKNALATVCAGSVPEASCQTSAMSSAAAACLHVPGTPDAARAATALKLQCGSPSSPSRPSSP